MKKILLIGKRGFLGNYLNRFLRKKFDTKFISFKEINNLKKNLGNYDYVINFYGFKNLVICLAVLRRKKEEDRIDFS